MLPEIPHRWRARYRQFDLIDWIGWISINHSDESFESRVSPQSLFRQENVIQWYKNGRNRLAEVHWPYTPASQSGSVILKSYQSRSSGNSLRLQFGTPRSVRHWDSAWILRTKGINTPLPVMLALRKNGRGQGLLAVEKVATHNRVRDVFPHNPDSETTLSIGPHVIEAQWFAEICGQYVREVHDQGVVHRDLSGGNILIPDKWDGTSVNLKKQFVMVDINRARQIPVKNLNINYRIQDLERLNIPDRYLKDYWFGYTGQDAGLQKHWYKFLKYRKDYRRIISTRNRLMRGALKTFTYWPRTR